MLLSSVFTNLYRYAPDQICTDLSLYPGEHYINILRTLIRVQHFLASVRKFAHGSRRKKIAGSKSMV